MNLNPFKNEMSLSRREDWNLILWGAIMITITLIWYFYQVYQLLLIPLGITMIVLFIYMATNNKKGLELKKQKEGK